MQSQKSQLRTLTGGGWFNRELKFLGLFLGLISFSNLILSNSTSALFVPTLSASVDQANLQINGNQVINSTNKTTEIPLNLTVNTNNKTGYTATLNSETDETALVNAGSTSGAKIDSISNDLSLNNLPNNTWGYKFGASSNYAPIPALSTPAQILQTTGKTNGNESNQLSIGMKLTDNLESGNYQNKLILSFVSNPYTPIAIMTKGRDFNNKLKSLETTTNEIEHFKKSAVAPATSMNAVNIEDEDSDYEIKLWLDPADKTAYYYTETEKVYLNTDSSKMFYDMRSLTSLNLSNFDTSKVTNMQYMFSVMYNLTTLNLSNFDTSKVEDMDNMFYYASSLTTLDLSNFDTSKVTDMSAMLASMRSLTSLNLSNFDTSKVTDMSSMFWGVSNLITLNLSNFNTSNVTNMSYMFASMRSLTSLNLSSFDTSKVTDMHAMFSGMTSLTVLDLSNFDTSQVTTMQSMFSDISNLTTLDLSNFDTSKVTDMYQMFSDMRSLTSLNLSNFDTSKVTNMGAMFYLEDADMPKDKLEIIYVNNDFNTASLTSAYKMFKNRKKLRGGNGSYLSNPSTADKTWLRIDDPAHGRPGYFTRKP